MKISIVSLGCSKNLVDSELIKGNLIKRGHSFTEVEEAEAIILNTCGFIGDAKRESINTALALVEYKKTGKCRKLVLTGCMVERYYGELKSEIPEIDGFWGTGNLGEIHTVLEEEDSEFESDAKGMLYDPDSPRELLTPGHSAYVKVSEGCSRTCTFCIIPEMRGKMKSRTIESIEEEIRILGKRGVREINLIAQDMSSYGRDIGTTLEHLLKRISYLNETEWIRLHYLYPWGMTDSLMSIINDSPTIVPYIDMPLQHINDRILKLMDRKTTREKTIDIIERLREKIDGLTLRTTFIVGFPTETEREFEELLEFIEDYGFERAGAFKYSREEGTGAAVMEGQLPDRVKEERLEQLMQTQAEVSYKKNLALVGQTRKALVDGIEDGKLYARLPSQAPEVDGVTHLSNGSKNLIGRFCNLKITGCDAYDLHASLEGK